MARYSDELREQVVRKMMLPNTQSIAQRGSGGAGRSVEQWTPTNEVWLKPPWDQESAGTAEKKVA